MNDETGWNINKAMLERLDQIHDNMMNVSVAIDGVAFHLTESDQDRWHDYAVAALNGMLANPQCWEELTYEQTYDIAQESATKMLEMEKKRWK